MERIDIINAVDDAVTQTEIISSTAQAIYDAAEYSPNSMQAYQMGFYGMIRSILTLKKELEYLRDNTYVPSNFDNLIKEEEE